MNFLKLNTWLPSLGLVLAATLHAQTNLTVGPVTYTAGQNLTFTATNVLTTSGAVVVSSGANISFQGGARVELKPGFHAQTGSTFHATVPDTDGDGLPDYWEALYGLNPFVNDASLDLDSDGPNNLLEYQNGTPPNNPDNTATSGTIYYGNPQFFGFTGNTQTFVVPPGVVSIRAKVWGAGGGAGYESTTARPRIPGGSGGYAEMEWGVVAGTTVTIVVGEGGQSARLTNTFGGGGFGAAQSGAGGGRSEVSAPNGARLVAGGGGGGGTNLVASAPSGQGGNGGGANQSGLPGGNNTNATAMGGAGGSLAAGGAGGAPNASSGSGSSLLGQGTPALGGAQYYGGGGGGGYFGGGAGSSWAGTSAQAAGGGGGSGYATIGLNVAGLQNNNCIDSYWGGLAGVGGSNGAGGNGRIVLLLGYSAAPVTPQITSASAVQLTKGTAGSYQIVATNSPTSYEIAGDPPPGMTVNAGAGLITGTPTEVGHYRFVLKAANNAGISSRELTISVVSAQTDYLLNSLGYSASGNYTTPANLYDKATFKVWGGGGGSMFYLNGSNRELRGVGGQGGYGQMDVSLSSGGGQLIDVIVGAGGQGRASVFRGSGGGRSEITLGSARLVAGGGGGAGGLQYYSGAGTGNGGTGGNGGGAGLSGNNGGTIADNSGFVAGGGTGGTTSGVGLGGVGHVPYGYSGAGHNAIGNAGGWGGNYASGSDSDRIGGEGGGGYFGGGGAGVIDIIWPTTTNSSLWWKHLVGAGGGGGSGYATGGTNVVGYNHNNSADPDWANSAGAVGAFANDNNGFNGRAGRAVVRLLTTRPTITSGTLWSVVKGIEASYSITTGLVATSYAIQSGALPAGLKLDGRSGIISGVATETGSFTVSVVASNDAGSHVALTLAITVTASASPQQYPPFITGFEAYEGYTAGASLANQAGWLVSQGYAEILSGSTPKGQQSVRLLGGSTPAIIRRGFLPAVNAPSVTFIDCLVQLTADTAVTSASRLDAGSSLVALVKNGAEGELKVFQPAGSGQGAWIATGKKYALDASNQTVAWVRLTVRQDYVTKKWDLYADEKLVATGLGLGDTTLTSFTQFVLQGHATGATRLDQLAIMNDNPLFTDADRDGMDDNWERANGLNPAIDDRTLDFDNDGLINLLEFRHGAAANVTDTDGDGFSDSQEITMGTSPTIPATADPNPPGIILHEPIGATLVP